MKSNSSVRKNPVKPKKHVSKNRKFGKLVNNTNHFSNL